MGTLDQLRVVEMAGLGPVPFAAMMLADMGAEVIRIDAPPRNSEDPHDHVGPIWRGRPAVELNLKDETDRHTARALITHADVLLEGFRPGVMERLGLGPEICTSDNPALVYGRMTGWGQHGARAHEAGHDINYLAANGVLRAIGRSGERPTPPLNLVGDFGGGGMLLLAGVLAALVERGKSGRGQVVDAAMVDGAALLMSSVLGWKANGSWREPPGTNAIDTGSPFYEVYETCDGGHLAVGAVEPRFYREFIAVLGLADVPDQYDRDTWPAMKKRVADAIGERSLAEWTEAFRERDACVTPVASVESALADPLFSDRPTYVRVGEEVHAAPAPRFSRTPSTLPGTNARAASADPDAVLSRWRG
ncbi:CaiB/BaiF CoA transferase family protein [Saccharopolyspora phatthalungensis]|uniref:Alpha-methylacyl-CoA racemase n=1 Tax=Saccharopolyspora phatthalungensis TaxID=664693 RepID=A0A840QG90_9PSEU|nr:CaiB/BaiF CoA-transferase family protein [Saccharopolyspora phatthalungensis]MBB5158970.1 alpha-methylacyl-CoA racemase [Saccharopolyspora phatthalungensis]